MDNPNVRILEKKHICSFCDFKTHKKYNLDLHMKNKHGNTIAQSTIYVRGDGGRPSNVQYGSDIVTN